MMMNLEGSVEALPSIPGGTEESHENPRSGETVSGPNSEPMNTRSERYCYTNPLDD
jgi:hypothetical protein